MKTEAAAASSARRGATRDVAGASDRCPLACAKRRLDLSLAGRGSSGHLTDPMRAPLPQRLKSCDSSKAPLGLTAPGLQSHRRLTPPSSRLTHPSSRLTLPPSRLIE